MPIESPPTLTDPNVLIESYPALGWLRDLEPVH